MSWLFAVAYLLLLGSLIFEVRAHRQTKRRAHSYWVEWGKCLDALHESNAACKELLATSIELADLAQKISHQHDGDLPTPSLN